MGCCVFVCFYSVVVFIAHRTQASHIWPLHELLPWWLVCTSEGAHLEILPKPLEKEPDGKLLLLTKVGVAPLNLNHLGICSHIWRPDPLNQFHKFST